ncbi:gamma-glutamylcyclotransferase [Alkalilimnicola sp. S0819]|uniref:gamma-glutamylcyclotransferase family protein n=1 Tax=Alkalilimnicola sp. S0819 TaxID=2613922 RepID=UPI0012622EFD|nr:gamma-glutamylcyclotransferase family protein [Alkalilimnicola sp. S0819]KAB7623625.1 gamma-glutamylcyclotransferase [Alkalilimnicola sp. S0819]MPQ16749.1 gamma-glutamylcyclotransferase [Alkalilimnicola sp. S0819]
MSQRVFVYGSLRRGEYNHSVLGDSPLLGPCRSAPGYQLYDLGPYPAVVRGGQGRVLGEVYAVDRTVFAALDRLEGYPEFYDRQLMATPYGEAWIYFARDAAADWVPVPEGDWAAWLRARAESARNLEVGE